MCEEISEHECRIKNVEEEEEEEITFSPFTNNMLSKFWFIDCKPSIKVKDFLLLR